MMGLSPRCYIPSFVEIGPSVLEKKIFIGFFIYGRGGHLGHVTQIPQFWRGRCLKMFENDVGRRGRRRTTTTDAGPLAYYKLTDEPSA